MCTFKGIKLNPQDIWYVNIDAYYGIGVDANHVRQLVLELRENKKGWALPKGDKTQGSNSYFRNISSNCIYNMDVNLLEIYSKRYIIQ